MRKTILLLFLIILSGCQNTTEIENPNGNFTDTDIQDLNWIVKEFDNILKSEYETNTAEKAYQKYSKEVWRGLSEEQPPNIPIPKGIEPLAIKLRNLKVFPKIWWIWRDKTNDIEVYNIGQKPYLTFLKERGKKSDFIKEYEQSLSSVADINPSVVAGFAKNTENLDLNDKNNRLIFAIHYLTLLNR